MSGCLLPQDDFFAMDGGRIVRLPDARNLPPRIIDSGRKPAQQETTIRVGTFNATTCRREDAEFAVFVDDESQAIDARWFIDPQSTYVPTPATPIIPGQRVGKVLTAPREVKSPVALASALIGFSDGKKHRVEVVVTDGDFTETASGGLDIRSNATGFDETGTPVAQPAYRTSFVWFVEVQPCP
ncbi:MAG: hypothetical protein JNG84_11730 [Archangium sp.]|nr:hypothetical protein [Archangium sp.]